ncbi:MAG: hypothetical protein VX095_06725 [Pseudomonadota bacterium]|nr:hypothetical protein [Pseudomonadota bacterium]
MSLIDITDGVVRPTDVDAPLRVKAVSEHAIFPTRRVSRSPLLRAIPLGLVFFVEAVVLGEAAESIKEE